VFAYIIERMFARIVLALGVAVFVWSALVRPAGSHPAKQVYVVQPYDTLWQIAASSYAGDTRDAVYRIQQANHLSGATLRAGQTLVLP
jgi:LysM repeat protein